MTQANPAELLGIPLGVGEPIANTDSDIRKRVKDGVLIMNPKENATSIEYVLANQQYSIAPGYSQPLPSEKSWVIRFDRGQGQGEASYTLAAGTYTFESTAKGWDLFSRTFEVTIDNSGNDSPFNYVADNTAAEVAGGQRRTHSSKYPILIRFDRGNGGKEVAKKVLDKKSSLQVGVSHGDGLWDLFPGDAANASQLADTTSPVSNTARKRAAALLLLQSQLNAQQ